MATLKNLNYLLERSYQIFITLEPHAANNNRQCNSIHYKICPEPKTAPSCICTDWTYYKNLLVYILCKEKKREEIFIELLAKYCEERREEFVRYIYVCVESKMHYESECMKSVSLIKK